MSGGCVRIAVATDVTVRGGVDGYVRDLCRALSAAGHTPLLLLEETTASALRTDDGDGRQVPRFTALYHRRHAPGALAAAATAVLAELAVDGLHVVCGSPMSCLALREEALRTGLPLVVTEQQIKDDLTVDAVAATRIRRTYIGAHAVIFVSEGNGRTAAARIGLDGVCSVVIPNGVDVAGIQARVRDGGGPRRPAAPARVMTAARFAREKCLDDLLIATSLLPTDLVERVDLFGEGPLQDELQELAIAVGVADRVFFIPWGTDMPEQMATHDLFVLPSAAEGMPYALLEAMAAGITIVASDVAGNVEALDDGHAGTLCARHSAHELAAAMRSRIEDPEGSIGIAEHARRRARDCYDVREQMRATLAVWDSLISAVRA